MVINQIHGANSRLLLYGMALVALDVLFFSFVSPIAGNSIMIVAGSMLLGTTFYTLLLAFMRALAYIIGISKSTQKRLTLFATVFLMFLLLLQSVGQLSGRDVLAAMTLAAVLYLYMSYISKGRTSNWGKETRV